MTKMAVLAAVAAAAVTGLALPFVGWALDVTDEAAVIDAFLDHTNSQADPDDVCVLSTPAFPEVAVVGIFAHDRGCMTQSIYVDGDWLAPSLASSAALQIAGWKDAADDGRAQMALAWTTFAGFAFSSPVTSPNDHFALPSAPAFVAPHATPDANAGAVVTLWVQEPVGMVPEAEYNLWELTFDRDGKTVRIRVLDSYTADF